MEKRFKTGKLKQRPKIIAITGAESTGKSTLSEELGKYYEVPFEPEFARDYVREIGNKYTFSDVEFIARKQVLQYEELAQSEHKLIILDTWLLITKVWFDVVFQKVPHWIEESIQKMPVDLFLVCDIDLPWMPDDVRENGGENRLKLHNRYLHEIKNYGFQYHIVNGAGAERTKNALTCINGLFE